MESWSLINRLSLYPAFVIWYSIILISLSFSVTPLSYTSIDGHVRAPHSSLSFSLIRLHACTLASHTLTLPHHFLPHRLSHVHSYPILSHPLDHFIPRSHIPAALLSNLVCFCIEPRFHCLYLDLGNCCRIFSPTRSTCRLFDLLFALRYCLSQTPSDDPFKRPSAPGVARATRFDCFQLLSEKVLLHLWLLLTRQTRQEERHNERTQRRTFSFVIQGRQARTNAGGGGLQGQRGEGCVQRRAQGM